MPVITKLKLLINAQQGITGLETAIILIGFVVVASVFAYTVLSTGLFATQKSSDTVYSGLEEARSTMETVGAIMLLDESDDNFVDKAKITLRLAAGGEPIDFTPKTVSSGTRNKVLVSYSDENQFISDMCFTRTAIGEDDGDNILEAGEVVEVIIPRLQTGTTNGLTTDLGTNTTFNFEIKPATGAALRIEKTTGRSIDLRMNMN